MVNIFDVKWSIGEERERVLKLIKFPAQEASEFQIKFKAWAMIWQVDHIIKFSSADARFDNNLQISASCLELCGRLIQGSE